MEMLQVTGKKKKKKTVEKDFVEKRNLRAENFTSFIKKENGL